MKENSGGRKMTNVLDVASEDASTGSDTEDRQAIATLLADVLADTYRLVFKTHAYHWNVTGPLFYSVHKLTEDQYREMFAATDGVAERIRALGMVAPFQFEDLFRRSNIQDLRKLPDTGEMVRDLATDHEKLSRTLSDLVALCADRNDQATSDLATERSSYHDKAAWMLRATIES
jgi:starvation-inducible DNA-binding protein